MPCVSNGYGFVCFENEEDALKFINSEKGENFEGIQTFKFTIKEPKDMKKSFNNLYIKDFDPKWDEEKIREIFSKYGVIKIVSVKEDSAKPERKFAFVCFEDPNNVEAGYISAEKAV